jgi:transcriptional regulator with XRE-family HTH domain
LPGRAKYAVPVDAKTIGKRLSEIRKSRGFTQVEIAEALGMTQALVSDYERGKLRLHGGLVVAFAKALRVSTDDILGLKDPAGPGPFKDRRFLRRLQQIETLPKRKKQALLTTLDEFLKGASTGQ